MKYPVGPSAVGLVNSKLLADAQKGFWVPSSLGLYYFDRRTESFTQRFQHNESNPDSLNDDAVISIYQDRSVLWVGTEKKAALAFYEDRSGTLWGRCARRYRDAREWFWASASPGQVAARRRTNANAIPASMPAATAMRTRRRFCVAR